MTCVVVGAGVAGLVAARELARTGADVLVLEAADRPGGTVAAQHLVGLVVDVGAESFATRTPAVADLITELGLADDVVVPAAGGAWLHARGRAVPLPRTGVLGIPGRPWAPDVRRVVGTAAAARAALDAVLPARLGTDEGATLGRLVSARMGRRTLDRLVAPVVSGVHSSHPDLLSADVVPGLRDAVRRHGSLAAAVAAMRAAAPAGSAVASLRGGMHRLVDALVADLAARGAVLRTGTRVTGLERTPGAGWTVRTADGDLPADRVVVALPPRQATTLLEPAVGPLPEVPEQHRVDLVTLVVDAPALDAAPRGTGVLVAPGGPVRAKALTHATAKWGWLATAAGPGRHVLRLSYGTAAAAPHPHTAADDDDLVAQARTDASALLGVRIDAGEVEASTRTTWTSGLPRALPGHAARVEHVRSAVAAAGGLAVCGAWVAGTGLAAVVPDARAAARARLDR